MPIKPLKLSREDLPKDIPAWADAVFEVLNGWAGAVTEALGRTSLVTKEITIKTGASIYSAFPIDIQNPLSATPTFILAGQVLLEDGTSLYDASVTVNWQMEGNLIRIRHVYGISSNTFYKVRLVIGAY